jgi:CRISPR-associated exonuclease Cas4
MGWLLLAAVVLGSLGLWLLMRSGAARRKTGLPLGRVTYVDTGAWDRCERPLFSNQHRLTGRPDYLVRVREGLVPVEVKSGAAPGQPYPAHVLQLAAYCLLVEEQEGRLPPYGILKYEDRAFELDYTPVLRAELLRTLDAIRHDLRAGSVDRSHDDPARCQGCGYREHCDQRLVG